MPRLGVLGWPVGHSRSPALHAAAFAALGMTGWRYQRLPVPPDLFAETLGALSAAGLRGANVTIPHKRAALDLADEADPVARAIGAVNTLSFDGGTIRAANTDAPGLLNALGVDVRGLRATVLGAGGSARAAVWALLDGGAADVTVWNRTYERALATARDLGAHAARKPPAGDVLVNCTAVGLGGHLSEADTLKQLGLSVDVLADCEYVVDLVYGDGRTALATAAGRVGARVVDGLDVLVHQGALSLAVWTGRVPPIDAMRVGARAAGA